MKYKNHELFRFYISIILILFFFSSCNIQKKSFTAEPVITENILNVDDSIIKILTIGNSFSEDAVEFYLHGLFKSEKISVIIGNLSIGGASLKLHLENAVNSKPAYSYKKIDIDGVKTTLSNTSLATAISDEEWDYISFQQVSHQSGLYNTYIQSLPTLFEYVKNKVENSKTKFVFHQTWAYAKNSQHGGFKNYDLNQDIMYEAIIQSTKRVKDLVPLDIIVPSGTAIQNARTSRIGDNFTRDGYHLSIPLGRYIASCTWFETITMKSVVGNTYHPEGLTQFEVDLAQQAAHLAVMKPYGITLMNDFKK